MAARKTRPARSRTIPANLHAATIARLRETDPDTGRPHTCASVAKWLDTAHGCPAHRLAVQRLRATVEKHTSAQVTAALREEIAEKVPALLAKVDRAARRVATLVGTEKNTQRAAAALNALTRATHELATLGGVAAPLAVDLTSGGQPLVDARATLAARLAGLAQEPEPGGADSAPGGPSSGDG